MGEHKMFAVDQAMKAHLALREAAGLAPEMFPVATFVGMISDEVQILRDRGKTDEEIAALIRNNAEIDLTANDIQENYAPPEMRRRDGTRT